MHGWRRTEGQAGRRGGVLPVAAGRLLPVLVSAVVAVGAAGAPAGAAKGASDRRSTPCEEMGRKAQGPPLVVDVLPDGPGAGPGLVRPGDRLRVALPADRRQSGPDRATATWVCMGSPGERPEAVPIDAPDGTRHRDGPGPGPDSLRVPPLPPGSTLCLRGYILRRRSQPVVTDAVCLVVAPSASRGAPDYEDRTGPDIHAKAAGPTAGAPPSPPPCPPAERRHACPRRAPNRKAGQRSVGNVGPGTDNGPGGAGNRLGPGRAGGQHHSAGGGASGGGGGAPDRCDDSGADVRQFPECGGGGGETAGEEESGADFGGGGGRSRPRGAPASPPAAAAPGSSNAPGPPTAAPAPPPQAQATPGAAPATVPPARPAPATVPPARPAPAAAPGAAPAAKAPAAATPAAAPKGPMARTGAEITRPLRLGLTLMLGGAVLRHGARRPAGRRHRRGRRHAARRQRKR